MTDWTAGYVADIGYTFGYYPDLNPQRLRLAFLNAGLAIPDIGTACELGFGQGLSTNVHAAASVTEWHGTDFNPAQAAFAQELAGASSSGARLYDDAFSDFCNRPDLPDFDYIGLHGIWSWISDENRTIIVDFVRRKLKVGGVLYVSYNTQPGWAAFAPMRNLLSEHAKVIGAEGQGIVSRIDGALDFAGKLLATNPGYGKANPYVAARIDKMKEQGRQYLAHEYFNRDWHPMHFGTMVEWLSGAKVSYACSANYNDYIDAINLTQEQIVFLREIPDAMFRESVRDFMVNQQFRRDYWVKGARKLSPLERIEGLRKQKVMLVTHRPDVSLKVTGALGEADLSELVYGPILEVLADYESHTLDDIAQAVETNGIQFAQIVEAVIVLSANGDLNTVQESNVVMAAKPHTEKLNAHLLNKARSSVDIAYLASPVIGGAVRVGRYTQLFLLAKSQGLQQPAEWAQFAWNILAAQGEAIFRDGKILDTAEENIAELTLLASAVAEKHLLIKALQIA